MSQTQSPPNRYIDPLDEPRGVGFYLRNFFPWLALAMAELGNKADAYERMSKLAPYEKAGYAPAHEWIAKLMMTNGLQLPREQAIPLAERHLIHWANQEPTDLDSRTALEGDKAKRAREILNPILAEGKAPALVHTILGSLAAADDNFELAAVHLEQACRLNPGYILICRSPEVVICL